MQTLVAYQIAVVIWASVGLLAYKKRAFYLGFCIALLISGGASALEYAVFFWVPVEFVFAIVDMFNGSSRSRKSN